MHVKRTRMDRHRAATIAVVEDDPALLESLKLVLESDGYTVLAFSSGSALIKSGLCAKCACVILDVNLAGEDGFEVLRGVRQLGHTMPAIMVSGRAPAETLARAVAAHADFLAKPVPPELLLRKISALMPSPSLRELPESWRFNFKSIDREHQRLIDGLNAAWTVFGENPRAPFHQLEAMFAALKRDLEEHFKSEEAEMAAVSYPGLNAHKEHHRSIANKLQTIESNAAGSGVVERIHLYSLLDALVDDMLRADIPFKTFLFDRGLIV